MEVPTFDYRNTPSSQHTGQQPGHESDTPAPARAIESASASTASQTNSSNFAYIATGIVLGVITLLAVAFTLLIFGAVGTAINSSFSDSFDASSYGIDDYEWEQFEHEHRDELDQLEEELWNEFMSENDYAA